MIKLIKSNLYFQMYRHNTIFAPCGVRLKLANIYTLHYYYIQHHQIIEPLELYYIIIFL